ncbi:MAG: YaaL family protein [Clostridia bacterium]|nr:YaaL family protein [Clostridia bacterium]
MKDEYVKETALVELTEVEREEELLLNIIKTKKDLQSARKNFEYVDSDDLVDYYIYQIKANQSKLDYLIKLAKARGIIADIINEVEFKLQNRAC